VSDRQYDPWQADGDESAPLFWTAEEAYEPVAGDPDARRSPRETDGLDADRGPAHPLVPPQYFQQTAYGQPTPYGQPPQHGDSSALAPSPNRPGSSWDTPPRPGHRSHWWIVAVAAVVVLVVVAAGVNLLRNHTKNSAQNGVPAPVPGQSLPVNPNPSQTPSLGPSTGPTNGSGTASVPAVKCPLIEDTVAHLAYRCVDDALLQGAPDDFLGLRVSMTLLVEPNWVVSEGSGDPDSYSRNPALDAYIRPRASTPLPTAAEVKNDVEQRNARAVQDAYGPSPVAHIVAAHTRVFGSVTGFELQTQVSIDSHFREETGLKAQTERLWVVGVPTEVGVSIFMMSIPDDRSDLWPKAEATIGTITVIP
jgi:hypothetical protein